MNNEELLKSFLKMILKEKKKKKKRKKKKPKFWDIGGPISTSPGLDGGGDAGGI